MICEEALRLGAEKLYISSHSSKESQAAYRALGCTPAEEINARLAARNAQDLLVGVLFGLTDYAYWLYITDLGVDREFTRQGIGRRLMQTAHQLAGGARRTLRCI